MEQEKEYRINNSTIKIIFGNILDSKAEVIVNSSGSKMTMGGGLTRAILEAGGDVIREDAQTKESGAGTLIHKWRAGCNKDS